MNEKYLRSAKPRLIMCAENSIRNGSWGVELGPHIRDVDLGWDELIDEGFDPNSKTGLGAADGQKARTRPRIAAKNFERSR
jgi:hypothetical protein